MIVHVTSPIYIEGDVRELDHSNCAFPGACATETVLPAARAGSPGRSHGAVHDRIERHPIPVQHHAHPRGRHHLVQQRRHGERRRIEPGDARHRECLNQLHGQRDDVQRGAAQALLSPSRRRPTPRRRPSMPRRTPGTRRCHPTPAATYFWTASH